MDYREALDYINGVSWRQSRLGLERETELLQRLGSPQAGLKFVHIAGTNGKGSVCAMLDSVLRRAGYRTGLFTSPYISKFNERMKINGKDIGNAELAELVGDIKLHADAMDEHPTEFEMITAAALLWFARQRCDIVVLEVGLGGRLDATNVIAAPECCVITNIGYDHTEVLGSTLPEIAAEKAGIIKYGAPVVLYQQSAEVTGVIRETCGERDAELTVADFDEIIPEFDSLDGQTFSYKGESYALPLLGAHQLRNAAVAIEAAEVLRSRGWNIEHEALEAGLYSVSWPTRFEIVRREEPCFVLDGGHNPQCAEALRDCIERYFPSSPRVALCGVLADKDYPAMLRTLAPLFDAAVCITPPSDRALEAVRLAESFAPYCAEVEAADSIDDGVDLACDIALEKSAVVVAFGSLYSCGAIRARFGLK